MWQGRRKPCKVGATCGTWRIIATLLSTLPTKTPCNCCSNASRVFRRRSGQRRGTCSTISLQPSSSTAQSPKPKQWTLEASRDTEEDEHGQTSAVFDAYPDKMTQDSDGPSGSRGGKRKRNAAEITQHKAAKLANMSEDARAEMQLNKEL